MTFHISILHLLSDSIITDPTKSVQHTAMVDMELPIRRRPALIPKDNALGADDIRSICSRTGHAIVPPPEPYSVQQAEKSQADFIHASLDAVNRGTKRKASTSSSSTYDPSS